MSSTYTDFWKVKFVMPFAKTGRASQHSGCYGATCMEYLVLPVVQFQHDFLKFEQQEYDDI